MNKTMAIVIAVVVLAGSWWVFSGDTVEEGVVAMPTATVQESVSPVASVSMTPSVFVSTSPLAGSITMGVIAQHNSAQSCYTVVRGSVYDVTAWINKHPGGKDAILSLCGKDGTTLFVDQHGGSGPQESQLATFKIGVLAK